jgi:hypothetical protein
MGDSKDMINILTKAYPWSSYKIIHRSSREYTKLRLACGEVRFLGLIFL